MGKLTVSDLRKLEKQVLQGEISYSKMVELINERTKQESDRKVMEFKEKLKSELNNLSISDFAGDVRWIGGCIWIRNKAIEIIEKLK